MERGSTGAEDEPRRFYHGARTQYEMGDVIEPDRDSGLVRFSAHLDGAIWEAELAPGEAAPKVYAVEPVGPAEDAGDREETAGVGHPTMSWRSRMPLRVLGEVQEWPWYHGTRADLKAGELISPGRATNFGAPERTANHVYMTRTLEAARWGAQLAAGDGPSRIYIVEPTGPIEADPNLTDKKFRGNPTQSFRSRAPLRVTGELVDWAGHSPEAIRAMKDGLQRLNRLGLDVIDD